LLRPGFHLRAADGDDVIVGQLGGVPVLPEGLAWPHWEGRGPLAFVAEIDCGQLPSDVLSLPRTGTLSFFCWGKHLPLRGTAETSAAARVVYIPAGARVSERDPPVGIASYDLVELTGELFPTGPTWDSPIFREAVADLGAHQAFLNDWSNGDEFRQALWDASPEPPHHHLGGHATSFQDAVELDVARAQLGGEVSYQDPALHQEALRWNLLAQFASDHWAKMTWGDCGTVYWLIRSHDLTSRRFEKASFTWQS
jgi:uncharacterized protein YwqG